MEFWRIYRLLFAKRYLILATVAIAGAVIALGTSIRTQERSFQAEAVLQPQETPKLSEQVATANGAGAGSQAADNQQQVSNLIMIMRSSNDLYVRTSDLLREDEGKRVLDVVRILKRNAYFASLDQEIASQASGLVASGDLQPADKAAWIAKNSHDERQRIAERLARGADASGAFAATGVKETEDVITDQIRKNMSFDTVAGPLSTDSTPQITDQIKVTGRFDREAEAKLYVNLICVAFLDYYTNQRASSMNARIALLREKRDEVDARLQRARQAKVAFLKSNKTAFNSQNDSAIAQAAQREAQRDAAQTDLSSASAQVASLQTALKAMQTTRQTRLPASENPEVKALQAQVDESNIAFQTIAAGNDGENSDRYKAAKARLDTALQELSEAKSRGYTTTTVTSGIDDLQSKLIAAQALRDEIQQRLSVLERQLSQQQAQLTNLPAAQAKVRDLDREIAISEQNVSGLETTIAKDETDNINEGKAGTIAIVSAAHDIPVVNAIAGQRTKLIVYGMALALLFSAGLVVALDALDNSVQTREDLEKLMGVPVAGIIPEHLSDPLRSPKVSLLEPLSPAAEAYRMLRTDLLFTSAEHPFQSLITATARPAQGATTTLCNLAIVLAQSGRRVVLVDADLRQPKLNRIFSRLNDVGLSSVLGGSVALDDALVGTEVDNLTLLPAGPFVTNPTDLLDSPRMQELHKQLKQHFDYVLFDAPTAIIFSDTAILSSFVDATLMVVRANSVPRGSEDQVRALLGKARANIIGAILNGVAPEQVDSVHYHLGSNYAALPAPPFSATPPTTPLPPAPVSERRITPGAVTEGEIPPSALPQPLAKFAGDRFLRAESQRYGDIPTQGGATAMESPTRSPMPLKMLLIVVVFGALLGGFVLLLGSGMNVR